MIHGRETFPGLGHEQENSSRAVMGSKRPHERVGVDFFRQKGLGPALIFDAVDADDVTGLQPRGESPPGSGGEFHASRERQRGKIRCSGGQRFHGLGGRIDPQHEQGPEGQLRGDGLGDRRRRFLDLDMAAGLPPDLGKQIAAGRHGIDSNRGKSSK